MCALFLWCNDDRLINDDQLSFGRLSHGTVFLVQDRWERHIVEGFGLLGLGDNRRRHIFLTKSPVKVRLDAVYRQIKERTSSRKLTKRAARNNFVVSHNPLEFLGGDFFEITNAFK